MVTGRNVTGGRPMGPRRGLIGAGITRAEGPPGPLGEPGQDRRGQGGARERSLEDSTM
jgi:hypothetical protein